MKIILPLLLLALGACSPSSTRDGVATDTVTHLAPVDSGASVSATSQDPPPEPSDNDTAELPFALERFIKGPFTSNFAAIKKSLTDNQIIFKDERMGEDSVLSFGSSRIEFLIATQDAIEAGLGDLICSADISDPRFTFNNEVAVGMGERKFLEMFDLAPDSFAKDEGGAIYFEREIPFESGHWKMKVFFVNEKASRFVYEITPCRYDYSD